MNFSANIIQPRLSKSVLWKGSIDKQSHAIAVRFPVDGPPELLDPGLKRAWRLSLYKLDRCLKRVENIYEVAVSL